MPDPLARRAAETPEAVALEAPGIRWSWGRLDEAAWRVAERLRRAGLGPHPDAAGAGAGAERHEGGHAARRRPVVAALLPRTPAGVAALHGVPRAGAILAPLHPGWTAAELEACLRRLRPAALLLPAEGAEAAASVEADVPRLPLEAPEDGGGNEGASGAGDRAEPSAAAAGGTRPREPATGGRDPDADHGADREADRDARRRAAGVREDPRGIQTIVATSGSSGRPRLVALPAGAHRASARAAARHLGLRPADRWLASLEPAHIGGLALLLRAAVVGCPVVLRRRFDAGEWNALLDSGTVTHASLVPTMLRRLLAARDGRPAPGALRCILLGGAAADPELLREALASGFPVAVTYGQTEMASQVATAPPALTRRKPGTAGPPLPGSALRIAADGEVRARGPTLMAGYWDEPCDDRFEDGWLRTGDLGRLDGEGHLWIAGRLSARIVTGGTNVDPLEVEAVLAAHPGVGEVVVAGVVDPEWGERVAAAVVPAEAFGVSRSELEAWCRERLTASKRPREWLFLESIPRTPSGKPDRRAVGVLFRATPHGPPGT